MLHHDIYPLTSFGSKQQNVLLDAAGNNLPFVGDGKSGKDQLCSQCGFEKDTTHVDVHDYRALP